MYLGGDRRWVPLFDCKRFLNEALLGREYKTQSTSKQDFLSERVNQASLSGAPNVNFRKICVRKTI